MEELKRAEMADRFDASIPLYQACIYSLQEKTEEGFRCIQRAIEKGLPDESLIDTLDLLAYLRIQPSFEAFKASGFTTFHFSEKK